MSSLSQSYFPSTYKFYESKITLYSFTCYCFHLGLIWRSIQTYKTQLQPEQGLPSSGYAEFITM